jgi:hypothetical protein
MGLATSKRNGEIVMSNQTNNKPTRKDRLRTLVNGVQKHFTGPVVLRGQTVTPAQIVAFLQQDIAATDASIQAHDAWLEKVQLEKASHQQLAPMLRALTSVVMGQFGDTPDAASTLGDFGLKPRKVPKRKVAAKAQAVAKGQATRTARHTMGKDQRKAVKGTVAAGTPATAPAASPAPVAPATPPGGAGTAKPGA